MKSALFRTLLLSPLAIGVAFARETPRVSMTLPDKPREVLTMSVDAPLMHRAIRRARDGLADFLELAKSPNRHMKGIAVRVALLERNEGEYIWISGFNEGDNGRFAGVVASDIHMQSRFKRGDPFTFVHGDIADWTYTDDRTGRIYGAYTECALMTLAPAEVAAKYRKDRKPDCDF